MSRRHLVHRLILVAAMAGAAVWVALHRDAVDSAALDAWLAEIGIWAPVIYVALYAIGATLFVPGVLFALAGGALFGPIWGTALNLVGATIGACLAFLVARYLAGDWVARRADGWLRRLIGGIEAEGWRFVAFIRLVPLFPFNLSNYALGLTQIGFLPYAITSFICMAPGAIAYTWLGHAGRKALAGDAEAIRYGLLALGVLATIVLLPRLFRRLRSTRAISWIEPEELHRQLRQRDALIVIDVRSADEFTGTLGHIPGALNVPSGELDRRLGDLQLESSGRIAVVCRTDKRSATAQATLHAAGFNSAVVLRGGMERWNALGFETVRDDATCGAATAAERCRALGRQDASDRGEANER